MTITKQQAIAPYYEPERMKLTAAEQVMRFRTRRHLKWAKRELRRFIRKHPKPTDGEDAWTKAKQWLRERIVMLEEQLP